MESADRIVRKGWGARVRTRRLALELTQVAAAERCEHDQSTQSKIETGDYPAMTPELILRLCLGLDMTPDDFAWPAAIVEIAEMRARSAA